MTSQFGCTWDFASFVVRFEFAAYATTLTMSFICMIITIQRCKSVESMIITVIMLFT